jgi:hypothetical protein
MKRGHLVKKGVGMGHRRRLRGLDHHTGDVIPRVPPK